GSLSFAICILILPTSGVLARLQYDPMHRRVLIRGKRLFVLTYFAVSSGAESVFPGIHDAAVKAFAAMRECRGLANGVYRNSNGYRLFAAIHWSSNSCHCRRFEILFRHLLP